MSVPDSASAESEPPFSVIESSLGTGRRIAHARSALVPRIAQNARRAGVSTATSSSGAQYRTSYGVYVSTGLRIARAQGDRGDATRSAMRASPISCRTIRYVSTGLCIARA
eukprot:1650885-Rhodomonas_salina.1